jgi:hypothetical protein
VWKRADEGFEVSLEGILELLLVLVAQFVSEHVGDALRVDTTQGSRWRERHGVSVGASACEVRAHERGARFGAWLERLKL